MARISLLLRRPGLLLHSDDLENPATLAAGDGIALEIIAGATRIGSNPVLSPGALGMLSQCIMKSSEASLESYSAPKDEAFLRAREAGEIVGGDGALRMSS